MSNDFIIEIVAINKQAAIFFTSGIINSETAPQLYTYIKDVIDQQTPRTLVIDVGQVPYISSAGIGVLMQLLEKILESRGIIILVNAHESIMRILSILGFTRYFSYAASMDEAYHILLAHLAQEQNASIISTYFKENYDYHV